MFKFPSISQFREVRRNVQWDWQFRGLDEAQQPIMDRDAVLPTLTFIGTPKIHGTNAAIVIEGDKVSYQSREREITPENDNCGFARWASQLPESVIDTLKNTYGDNIIVFGEWAGKGVQSGVGVSQIEKFFTIFAVRPINDEEGWIDILTYFIQFPDSRIFNVFTFGSVTATVNFNDIEKDLDFINKASLEVEAQCPVAAKFGVNGIGEGRVWRCLDKNLSRYVYKVKGEKHSESKAPKLATANPEKVKSVDDFVQKHVHEGRLNQAWNWLAEMGHPQTEKSTGHFIKWVVSDVHKEEGDELAFNGLTEKDVNGPMSTTARKWFFEKFNKEGL